MESVLGFLMGFAIWAGFVLAVPVAVALMLGLVVLLSKVFKEPVVETVASWLSFDAEAAYAPNHTWLRQTGERLRVGLDDLALRLLPGVSEVTVPETGRQIAAGEPLAVLKLGAVEVPIRSPIAGKVSARNAGAHSTMSLKGITGWLVELEPTGPATELRRGDDAKAWLDQESTRLVAYAERELGLAAADGGEVAMASMDAVPEEKWRALLKDFLQAEPRKA